ncbi:hypothetical protein AVEN_160359-1 [Araneus ventricosus]|uniref:Uncharacterized protein n=1 Tax=Araneus ventricosus TaxID=182803 RepID=A0A4Y2SS39_ARAVE|nr:hypothetical protein AVEN_160359-1 [Araneus ventricosus]
MAHQKRRHLNCNVAENGNTYTGPRGRNRQLSNSETSGITLSLVRLSVFPQSFFRAQRIIVARGFVGRLDRSGERSANAGASKETSPRTGTSAQFLQVIVDCVYVVGTVVRLVEFRPANPQRRKWIAKKLTVVTGL